MVNGINIRNVVTGDSIDITKTSDMFVLDSIDWDSPAVTMNTYRTPFQVGESLSGVTIGKRFPSLTGYVVSRVEDVSLTGKTWDEYYALQEEGINQNKRILDKIFNVSEDVVITANGYMLNARPSTPVKYSTYEQENNEVMCLFTVSFECFYPLFYKDSITVDLASVSEAFEFPLEIPEDGIVFGEIMRRQSVTVQNDGDIDVGCEIIIRASGGVVEDPKIYDVYSGEFMEFSGVSLSDGDYIRITTETNEEGAIKHSAESGDVSIVGQIVEDSTFLKIRKGSSLYAYRVEEEQQNNIEVSVSFAPKYYNFEGM